MTNKSSPKLPQFEKIKKKPKNKKMRKYTSGEFQTKMNAT